MGGAKTVDAKDLVTGGVLQCLEAATVGMPFEVWKTYMGTYRTESTMQAFKSIYNKGGVSAFWKGWQPKMVSFELMDRPRIDHSCTSRNYTRY
jgi:hypothetical protein